MLRTDDLFDRLHRDDGWVFPSLSFHAGNFAADSADLALQIADARLIGVLADDPTDRARLKCDVELINPIFIHLAWDEVTIGNLEFLFFDVTGEVNHFHSV